MTSDEFDKVILLGKLIIAAVPTTILSLSGISKWAEVQSTKIREQSVGQTKVNMLQDCMNKLASEFELFKSKFDTQSKRIDELHEDNKSLKRGNDELIQTIMKWVQDKH